MEFDLSFPFHTRDGGVFSDGGGVIDPEDFLKAYLSRITRGDTSAVSKHFHPLAAAYYVQHDDLIRVPFSELLDLIADWKSGDDFDPGVGVKLIYQDPVFAVLSAEFNEPQGIHFQCVFNLYRTGDTWKIWSATGRASDIFDQRAGREDAPNTDR